MNTIEDKIQKGKNILGKRINCSLEVLSPVHIGSGIKLQKNFDYLSEGNYTIIFTKEEIEKLLIDNPEIIDEFDKNDFNPSSYLKNIKNPRRYNVKCFARDILEFERNGEGIPYIPGSSFKGAIRTVLLNSFFKSKSSDEQNQLLSKIDYTRPKFASDPIQKDLFGEDSNHNLFRAISISDIYFDNSNLNLLCTYVLSLSSENSYKWKKMGGNNPNSDNIREATAIYSEMINIGSKANFSLKIEDFLFTNSISKTELRFDHFAINDLAKKINSYSKTKIQNEIKFIHKINSNNKLDILKKYLEEMESIISLDNTNEFIIRLSWGSGWKGMTGDFLSTEALTKVRNKFRLGKNGFNIFPKSRKIVFIGQTPTYFTGWVKVKINHNFSKDEILNTESLINIESDKSSFISNEVMSNVDQVPEKIVPSQSNYIKAVIINSNSKPPIVKILEREHEKIETILPGVNLVNLDLKDGSEVLVELAFDKKKKPQKAIYKGKT